MSVLKRRLRVLKALVVAMLIVTAVPAVPLSAGAATAPSAPRYQSFKNGPEGPLAKPAAREAKRLNVKWAPGIPKAQIDAAAANLGFRVVATSKRTGWTSIAPARANARIGDLATALRKARLASRIEEEKVYSAAEVVMPNDPRFGMQWSLRNTGQTGGTPDADIDAPEAWTSIGTGSSSVTVAVVDTGVMRNHPDLVDNMWVNADEIPGNGRDDDSNGYVDDRYGYDFCNYDSTVYDVADGDQHGTHVSGIIGATGDNSLGVAGVNWDVTIMPVKFLGPWGGGDFEGAEAIVYAVDNGADIINCSWGGEGESEVLADAIDYAAERGVLLVCASGNWGQDLDPLEYRNFPSSYDSTAVVAVAATDHNDKLADFSNYGAQYVDIAAPGADVLSTLPSEPTAFYINELPHKIVYLPFVAEALEPADARDAMIVKSVQKLGASAATPILVVDDSMPAGNSESPGERAVVYTDALGDAGYTNVSVWNTEESGTPSAFAMQGKLVIWFTGRASAGWDAEECVNAEERGAITGYLQAGGRLLMASGELATDMEYWGFDYEWFESTFHCFLFDLMTWGSDIKGKPGTVFDGLELSIPNAYQNWDTEFAPTGSDAVVAMDSLAVPLAVVGGYGNLSGTSMAAPTVTGAAALLMSAMPDMSAEEARARLENTGDHLTALEGKCVYESRINVASALEAYPGRPIIDAPAPGAKLRAGDETLISWHPPSGADPGASFEAQYGLPYTLWSEDFESASLASMEVSSTSGDGLWYATDVPEEVLSGDWASRSGDVSPGYEEDGWIIGNVTSLNKTITIPDGGGKVGFWWWWDADMFDTTSAFAVDGMLIDWPFETFGWTYREVPLTAGEHTLSWQFVRFLETNVGADGMGVDDITVTAYDYTDIPTGGVGDMDTEWTVPAVDTDDAQIRVRAKLGDVYSPWAYSRPIKISTDLLAPAAPTDLAAIDDADGGVDVSWINPADVDFDFVRVVASTEGYPAGPNDPSAEVVYEGADASVHDGLYAGGATVYYAAFACDLAGNWSEAAEAMVTVTDTVVPDPVSMLSADMVDGAPALSWMNPASNFEAVKVLRRTDGFPASPDDPEAVLVYDGVDASAVDYALAEEGYNGPAYYSVWVCDASGNVSQVAQASIDIDTTVPEGEFYLNGDDPWTASTSVTADAWITGATEMRLFANGEIDEDAPWVAFAEASEVQLLAIEGVQSVVAQFRGANGAVVEYYDEIYVNLNPPAAPTGLAAQTYGGKVRLTWDEPNMWPEQMGMRISQTEEPPFVEDVVIWSYKIFVAESEEGPYELYAEEVPPIGSWLVGGLEPGETYWFKIAAVDATGLESELSEAVSGVAGESAERVAGANRYATSAAVSAATWETADTVVIASGEGFADALGASALAGYYDAPVLLVTRAQIPPEVRQEITRLGATNAVIVGGASAVSPEAEYDLEESGIGTSRIAGANRYETAQLCAQELVSLMGDEASAQVFLVSGVNYADALAVAPIAFANRIPVLLTAATTLPEPTADALDALDPFEVDIVGGKAAISTDVEDAIPAEVVRLAGANRYATAAGVMAWAGDTGLARFDTVGIASSASFADGLSGGAAIGHLNGVMLFTAPTALPADTFDALMDNGDQIGQVMAFGGTKALSDDVLDLIAIAVGGGVNY